MLLLRAALYKHSIYCQSNELVSTRKAIVNISFRTSGLHLEWYWELPNEKQLEEAEGDNLLAANPMDRVQQERLSQIFPYLKISIRKSLEDPMTGDI